jgi:hypothetical protein
MIDMTLWNHPRFHGLILHVIEYDVQLVDPGRICSTGKCQAVSDNNMA